VQVVPVGIAGDVRGTLFPGVMPLMVALLAAVILKEAFSLQKNIGLVLIS
jgi:uncharacterized membrane protein